MIVEIIGNKTIKANGDVQVDYVDGKIVIYNSENTKHLVLNPSSISAIVVGKEKKMI